MGASETKQSSAITEREKALVRSSWDEAMKNKREFSVDIFLRVFAAAPAAQDMFEQLRGISTAELKTHRKMRAHGLRVVASLNSLVEEIDNPDTASEMFRNIARTHQGHKVVKDHYELLGKVLMDAFKAELKGKFTEETQTAWLKVYGIMISFILEEYGRMEQSNRG